MKKFILILLLLMILPSSSALFGFDEFIDDDPQLIQETVENENGNVCTDCNVSMRINFPNGTLESFNFMTFNSTASKYDKQLNLKLVNDNTTIYSVTITANRTTASQIFNGTSDRTQITIYDVFPPADNLADVAIATILITISGVLVYLAIKFDDQHCLLLFLYNYYFQLVE